MKTQTEAEYGIDAVFYFPGPLIYQDTDRMNHDEGDSLCTP